MENLTNYLKDKVPNEKEEVELSFSELETIVGILSPSARKYCYYWSNAKSNNENNKHWINAGFEVKRPFNEIIKRESVVFKRISTDISNTISHKEETKPMKNKPNKPTKLLIKIDSNLAASDSNLAASILGYFYRTIGVDKKESTQRYLSWEHCYSFFRQMKSKYFNIPDFTHHPDWEKDLDMMALHLGFYLASWGMYRGSSFFLQHDYKFHKNIIIYLFTERVLWESDFSKAEDLYNVFKDHSDNELDTLSESFDRKLLIDTKKQYFGNGSFNNGISDINSEDSEVSGRDVTQTQLTKILLGVCGCIPAYDRFFCDGIKRNSISRSALYKLSAKSFSQLVEYWKTNGTAIINILSNVNALPFFNMPNDEIQYYPPMKLLDMLFWQLGMLYSIIDNYRKTQDNKDKATVISFLSLHRAIISENFRGLLPPKEIFKRLDKDIIVKYDRIKDVDTKIEKLYDDVCKIAKRQKNSENSISEKCDYLIEYLPKKTKLPNIDFSVFN